MQAKALRSMLLGAVLAAGLLPASAWADSTNSIVYRLKDWEVRSVAWDDGTTACVAEVSYAKDSFSIWADKTNPIRLQFFSTDWNFNEGVTDLKLRIDGRASWTLRDADLYKNSILFDLPTSNAGTQFLAEVAHGDTLYLMETDGREVQDYSLSGSRASIVALSDCVDALK